MNIYQEAFVYQWTNLTNNYIYIGYHKGSPEDGYICSSKSDRFWNDFNDPNQTFERKIIAYGTCDEMCQLERKLLNEIDIYSNNVYNNGNASGMVYTDEVRKKLSEKKLGKNNPNFGKVFSEEHRKNLSESRQKQVRKQLTSKAKSNISKAKKGKSIGSPSEEHRNNLSNSLKGIIWITNGVEKRGIKQDIEIPQGWWKGEPKRKKKKV